MSFVLTYLKQIPLVIFPLYREINISFQKYLKGGVAAIAYSVSKDLQYSQIKFRGKMNEKASMVT